MKKPILLLWGLCLSVLFCTAQDYTVFNFEDTQPANVGSWSDTFVSSSNPTKDAVNGSNTAGIYTHKSQWSDVSVNTPNLDSRIYTSYEIKYCSPYATSGVISIACFAADGTQLDWFEPQVTAAGVWVKQTRTISFAKKIARVMVAFRRSSSADPTPNNNLIYFDDFIFKKAAGPDYALYNENFRAGYNWYDGTAVVAPSTRNGRWSGFVNATTPGDASITLVKNWNIDRERELLLAPSAAATSPGPVVTFTGVDVAGFYNLKLQIGAAWPNISAESADFNNAGLAAALKTPKLELQSGSGSWVSIPLVPLVVEPATASVQTFDLSSYSLGSGVTTMNIRLTSAPNLTTVFYNMVITGRIPTITWNQDLSALQTTDSPVTLTATSTVSSSSTPVGTDITYTSGNNAVVTVSGSTLTVVGPGTTSITAKQAANSNYNAAIDVVKNVTVSKVTPTLSVSGTQSFSYNGSAQGPATISYSGDATPTKLYTSTDGGGWSSSTAPTNAGAYQVVASAVATSKYNAATSSAYTFTINKASSSISITGNTSFTYNGSAQGPATSSVTGSTGTVTYSYSGSGYGPSATAPTAVGSYTVTATVAANNNYNSASSSATGFTIAKANSSISVTGNTSFNYNGLSQGPATTSVSGSTGTVTFSYAGTGATSYGPSATAPTAVGTYSVTASVAADANYNGATSSETGFTISAVAPGVPTAASATAGNAQASVSFTTPSNDGGTSIIDYTVTSTPGSLTATGTSSPIIVTGLTNGTAYTFTVSARNSVGSSSASSASNSVTPAPTSVSVSSNSNLSSYFPSSATDVTVNSAELNVDADATVKTMTVAPGAKLTIASGKTLTVIGALTLRSDATGTATLVDNGGTISSASTNVQQYLTTGRNWYVSSPVTAAKSDVLSATVQNPVYWYDEAHGTSAPWPTITNTTTDLTVMKGYVVNLASNGVVNFSGTLNTGDKSVNVSRTEGQEKAGFNLVGNPYPSYLDWDNVTKTNLLTSVWYRTKTANDVYTFDTYNSNGKVSTSNGVKAITNLIPPMQAFWVRVAQGQTTGTLSVTNSQRAHTNNGSNTFKSKSNTESTQPVLRLEVSNGINSDQALVYFNTGASNSYDDYDSPKMSNAVTSVPEIYTLAGSEQVAINGVNDITQLALGFTTGEANNFKIKASQFAGFVQGTQIILRDNSLNYEQDLTMSDYNFYSDVTTNNETRFTVLFRSPSITTGIDQNSASNVWISLANNQIVLNGITGETTVAVYNAVGQKILSQRQTASTKALDTKLTSGVYMVSVTNAGKTITRKIIID